MKPRLSAVAGPLSDSTFLLEGDELAIGRDPSNRISINDPAVSRRHCLVIRDDGKYWLRDLGSCNGSFVNGVTVKEVELHHGDQITLGNSVLVFSLREIGPEPATGPVEFDDGLTRATAQIRPQDTIYLHPDRILGALPPASRVGTSL